jgi:hypothetical protein
MGETEFDHGKVDLDRDSSGYYMHSMGILLLADLPDPRSRWDP